MRIVLTPEILLSAYAQGLFPMAQSAQSDDVQWICPELRGQISIRAMHVPKRLKKSVRQMKIQGQFYEIRINTDFEGVIKACAQEASGRTETWINPQIIEAYCKLNILGYAHSVECWQDDILVGGLYGIALGGAFFGESMFSCKTDTSKVALVHLAARLYHAGYDILDTQFTNPHLEQFGVYEIPHDDYMDKLTAALDKSCDFGCRGQTERQLIASYFEMQG
tara:strand:+ start:14493 stop:15158 length:666 start_codon:yes stop_codon:yes gene_type:complete